MQAAITINEQRFIPDTGYLVLKGEVTGMDNGGTLKAYNGDDMVAETAISPGSPGMWQFENLTPVRIEENVRLVVEQEGNAVCELDVAPELDETLMNVLGQLRGSFTVKVFGLDDSTHTDNPAALEALDASEFTVVREKLDQDAFKAWMDEVDYESNYPKYVQEFPKGGLLEAKAAQHYVSILLSDPKAETLFMDTASSNSPFWKLVDRIYGVEKAYRQDLNFKAGVHGDTVGSNVSAIPFEDEGISMITAHCSWEHFEGDADVEYFSECARILKPGGTMVIVPVYFANEYSAHTSPHIWDRKYVAAEGHPKFDAQAVVYLREPIRQRLSKFYTGPQLIERILRPFAATFEFSLHYYENYQEIEGCPAFALKAMKK